MMVHSCGRLEWRYHGSLGQRHIRIILLGSCYSFGSLLPLRPDDKEKYGEDAKSGYKEASHNDYVKDDCV